jgi:predicted ester cyclase
MSEQHKTTARRFFQEQDRLRGGPADELCADGYTARLASFPAMDLAGHKQFAATFYGAFPDLEHHVEDVIAEGNRVAVRFRVTGTNTQSFMGSPPSGRPMEFDALAVMTIDAGKVTELFGQFDQLGVLQQLGAPADARGAPA